MFTLMFQGQLSILVFPECVWTMKYVYFKISGSAQHPGIS